MLHASICNAHLNVLQFLENELLSERTKSI